MRLIIDGHLDLAWNALAWRRDLTLDAASINARELGISDDDARGHVTTTLPDMRRGSVAICMATVLARCANPNTVHHYPGALSLDFPTQLQAAASATGQLGYYHALEHAGHIRMIENREALAEHFQSWRDATDSQRQSMPIGLILAMEGSDPILDCDHAAHWRRKGLRCASLVHYGRSAYAVGTGHDGPLTAAGRRLLKAFERLGIILDTTHLSDTSFFEAMDAYGGPVLASHQNCRALVPNPRQFTDAQLRRVIERGGVIGTALDAWMLYDGWEMGRTSRSVVNLQAVADHIDHICQLAGNHRHAAIGSDLDGGFGSEQTPQGLDTIADLQKLDDILQSRGYDDDAVDAIFHGNWLRFLTEHLPAGAECRSGINTRRDDSY